MNIKLQPPKATDLRPRLTVIGVGGAGGNAVNNMISSGLQGVDFVVANTDAQALSASSAEHRLQLGMNLTEGLGAGSKPEIGEAAAEEAIDEIRAQISGSHMVFIAAGMGGGTGTGAAGVIARIAKELGVLAVGVVTKPFQFEGARRQRIAEAGIAELKKHVDTLIVIPNQNLFRIANAKTTFAEAFVLADQVLYSGIACIVDLIVKEGLINLDFADVRTVMSGMGTAMMGTGEAEGERRAILAAEEAICNPLLDDVTLRGAKGLLLSIIGGRSLTLFEVDEAATRVRKEVDPEANIIVGATFDESLGDRIRVSIVASGMARQSEAAVHYQPSPMSASTSVPTHPGQIAQQPRPAVPMAPPATAGQAPGDRKASADFDRLTRMLTDAIDPSVNGPRTPQDVEAWQGPGEVQVRPTKPTFGSSMLPPPLPPEARLPRPMDLGFSPGPPADTGRGPPRMPTIDDFPQIAQSEYRAKAGQPAGAPMQRSPQIYSSAHQHQPRRRGLLERIGFGRRADAAESVYRTGGQRDVTASHPIARPEAEQSAPREPRGASGESSESADLPSFFRGRRAR